MNSFAMKFHLLFVAMLPHCPRHIVGYLGSETSSYFGDDKLGGGLDGLSLMVSNKITFLQPTCTQLFCAPMYRRYRKYG